MNSKCKSGSKAYVIATASPELFPEVLNKAGEKMEMGNQSEGNFVANLRARQRKEPKLMRKEENWYNVLQDEIKNTRENQTK